MEKLPEQIYPNIQTQKEKIDWAPFAFQYKFKFPDNTNRKEGDAQLFFRSLGDWAGNDEKLITFFNGKGVKSTDTIAHLNEFYPNGRGLDEKEVEYMREGVGSIILSQLIEEARENGARLMYVFTGKTSMVNFLEKHGFECLDKEEKSRFFKIFEQGDT